MLKACLKFLQFVFDELGADERNVVEKMQVGVAREYLECMT